VHPDSKTRGTRAPRKPLALTDRAITLVSGAQTTAREKAQWALANASNLLSAEYMRARGTSDSAEDLALAAAVAWQLVRSLADPTAADRATLKKMARGLLRPKIHKSDAESWLLEKLPATAAEARLEYPSYSYRFGHRPPGPPRIDHVPHVDGATNLAREALCRLAAQPHADAAKVLQRWGMDRVWDELDAKNSAQFTEDVEELASDVRLLMGEGNIPDGLTFAEALVDCMYHLLRLKRPREASKRKAARSR